MKKTLYFQLSFAYILFFITICRGQKTKSQGFEIIKTVKIEKANAKSKKVTLMTFDYNPAKKNFLNLEKGKYEYSFERFDEKKSKIILRELNTKKEISSDAVYLPNTPHIPPINECKRHEESKWRNFRNNVLPLLQNNVNRHCKSVYYCLTITCDGNPTVSYLMIIAPNWRKCSIPIPATEYIEQIRNSFRF